MTRYSDYSNEQKDFCDICEEQSAFLYALALDRACIQIGK